MPNCQNNCKGSHLLIKKGNCKKNVKVPGCWQYCNQYIDKYGNFKNLQYYSRRCGTGYDTISYSGPSGNSDSFAGVLFTKKVPGWLFVDQSLRHSKGPKSCPNRCKGHKKANVCWNNGKITPTTQTTSKSTIPVMNSYEDVLAIRKTMAFYDPRNFKKSKKFRRSCCKI